MDPAISSYGGRRQLSEVDEEEGSINSSFSGGNGAPTTSSPPSTARPSLHGLDRILSTRFAIDSPTSPTSSQTSNNQQQQQGPTFSDYLQAQKKLQSRRRLNAELSTGTSANPSSSLGTNLKVASAVAKLRRKSQQHEESSTDQQQQQQQVDTDNNTAATTTANKKSIAKLDSFGWDQIFNEIQHIDEDGHFTDHDHHHVVPLYSPPIQRQRWNEDTLLPHVNWGDLFFDLFYVAMAYNLGAMLTTSMNSQHWLRGIIFYIGTFGPLWTTWESSMMYESRYTVVDYAHRLFEVIRYLFVSTAIIHVKSVELFTDLSSTETLLFTCAILGESLMHLMLNIETYFRGKGDREAIQNHTMRKMKYQHGPTILVYLAAVIVAAVEFAIHQKEEASGYEGEGEKGYDESGGSGYDEEDRMLADATPGASYYSSYEQQPLWKVSDLPITLMALAYLFNIVSTAFRKYWATSGKYGDLRKQFVPNNVDYVIHRYGEFVLLMIGEGILSLLIVETAEVKDYYFITTFGTLTIIFISILKFESEPSHADGHALWRNLLSAMNYSYLVQLLSMALIVYGVTYKIFLKDVVKDADKELQHLNGPYGEAARRSLAASPAISDEVSSAVFSSALGVVLIALEVMRWTHGGIKESFEYLVMRDNKGKISKPHWPIVIISVFKIGILLFTFTLSQWTIEPEVLTLCGCGIVIAMAITRVLSFGFIHKKERIQKLIATATERATAILPLLSENDTARSRVSIAVKKTMAKIERGSNEGDIIEEDNATELDNVSKRNNSISSAATDNEEASSSLDKRTSDGLGSIDNSFDAIVVANLDGIMTRVNDTAVTLFGYESKQEMVGKNLSIIVGGGDAMRHHGYVSAFKKRVNSQENPGQKVLGRQRMLQGCKADGTEFPCVIGIKMINNNTRIVGYIRDMSGVLSKEKDKVKEVLLHIVDDHAFDAIVVCNHDGTIQNVNEAAVEEFGYESKDELVGKNLSTLIHSITPKQLIESHGEQRVVELTKKNGAEFPSIVASKKIKGANDMFVSYIRNIHHVSGSIRVEKFD